MAKKITDLSALTSVAVGDLVHIIDISDTTDDAAGSSRKITVANLTAGSQPLNANLTALTTAFSAASASGPATLAFHEDTDNGTNKVTLSAPSSVAADVTVTLPGTADTLVGRDTTDTLTNKTLTSPVLTTPVINTSISGTAIASGAEVTTGTDNTKIVTPKSLGDAGVNTRLKSKIITATRDYAAVAGDVSYTGVGFKPTAIIVFFGKSAATVGDGMGFADSAVSEYVINNRQNNNTQSFTANFVYSDISAGALISAVVKTFDSDGFTLTWSKTGSPTGTMNLVFICLR